ncbi:MAG: deoxyguanosinetriphosphate triphosphohydrolase [Pseudomonadota bacterium]
MSKRAETPPPEGGVRWRAPYAVDPAASRGRLHPEEESVHRSPFQRDRDRIIHCNAFRRLKHKTQVFVEHEGDYYRTRLTHSIEVAQVARTVARALGLDEDLAEAVALAHDLGHTPFGHAGEKELDRLTSKIGGFDHNAQALKITTSLERRYAAFPGLNLSWETLEGLVKHNGPLSGRKAKNQAYPVPPPILSYDARHPLELTTFASAEAQAAALADDIAYNNHDLDDGLRAGLFTFEEACEVALLRRERDAVLAKHGASLEPALLQLETLRRVFGAMVVDLIEESRRRLAAADPQSAADVRAAPEPLVAFSREMMFLLAPLRAFLVVHMYRAPRVNRMMSKSRRVLREIFQALCADIDLLPEEWRAKAWDTEEDDDTLRVVADYVAGMTDRFAIEEHRKLFDPRSGP